MKNRIFKGLAALGLTAVLAAPAIGSADAADYRPCVTSGEYNLLNVGQSPWKVGQILDGPGTFLYGLGEPRDGYGLFMVRYRICASSQPTLQARQVYIQYFDFNGGTGVQWRAVGIWRG